MKSFIKSFVREPDGKWTCVAPAELGTVQGRVRIMPGTWFAPGTLFIGIDLVGMLENEINRVRGNSI